MKTKRPLTILLAVALLSIATSCGNTETVEQEAYGMVEKFEVSKQTGFKQGKFEKFDDTGKLFESSTYNNNQLEGLRTLYRADGSREIVETYSAGTLHGPFKAYYEGETLEIEGQYVGGVMTGGWKRYYKNTQLMEEVTFDDNLENGPFKEYYENGNLKAEGQYYRGPNEHGLLKLYDESGIVYRRMECDSGICRTVWLSPDYEEASNE